MRTCNLFNPKNKEHNREAILELLKAEEKDGYVEIIRNDYFELSNGVLVDIIEAKIIKGKRGLNFNLHYNGFLLKAKTLSLSGSDYLHIGEQAVDLKFVKMQDNNWADNISISVDY